MKMMGVCGDLLMMWCVVTAMNAAINHAMLPVVGVVTACSQANVQKRLIYEAEPHHTHALS